MPTMPAEIWEDVVSLRPIIAECRSELDVLGRLPEAVVRAFADRDIYRFLLPVDLGGKGLDPLDVFDLTEEVASCDGSVGWNFAIGTSCGTIAGVLRQDVARAIFSGPGVGIAGSGPPQGRAVPEAGGFRVSGRFAWASGIHNSAWVVGGCFVEGGDQSAKDIRQASPVIHVLVPVSEVSVLDAWHTGGMRGTGSTEFEMREVFVPDTHAVTLFGAEPLHPAPLFRLPTTYFGFTLTAVPLAIARSAIEGLKRLAIEKRPTPPRLGLAQQPDVQYIVGKTEAMVEAARLSVRAAFSGMWREVQEEGAASLESRARLRRASVHAVETSVEAVSQCYRAAGGSALFRDQPFERALRDVNAVAGHIVFQREMMVDCGRVAMGIPPQLAMF